MQGVSAASGSNVDQLDNHQETHTLAELRALHENIPQIDLKPFLFKSKVNETITTQDITDAVKKFQRSHLFNSFCQSMLNDLQTIHQACFDGQAPEFSSSNWGYLARRLKLEHGLSDFQGIEYQLFAIYQISCRELRQIAVLAKALSSSPDNGIQADIKFAILQTLKDLSTEITVCGPGLQDNIQLAAHKLQLMVFPPSLSNQFQRIALEKFRQVLGDFVLTVFKNDPYLINNHIHMVNALHGKLHREFNLPPPIDDIHAGQNYVNAITDREWRDLKSILREYHLHPSEIAITLAEEILGELKQNCESTRVDFVKQVGDLLSAKEGTIGKININSVLKENDDFGFQFHSNPTLLAVSLLHEHKHKFISLANFNQKLELLSNKKTQLYEYGSLIWLENQQPMHGQELNLVSFDDINLEFIKEITNNITLSDYSRIYCHILHECLRNQSGNGNLYFQNHAYTQHRNLEHMSAARIALSNMPEYKRLIEPKKIINDLEFLGILKTSTMIANDFTIEELVQGTKTLESKPGERIQTLRAFDANAIIRNTFQPVQCDKVFTALLHIAITMDEFNADVMIRQLIAGGKCQRAEIILDMMKEKPDSKVAFEYLIGAIHHNPSSSLIKTLIDLCHASIAPIYGKPFISFVIENVRNSQTILRMIDDLVGRGMEYPLTTIDCDPIGIAATQGKWDVLQRMKQKSFWCQNTNNEYTTIFNELLLTNTLSDDATANVLDIFLSTNLVSTPSQNETKAIQSFCESLNRNQTLAMLLKHTNNLNHYEKGYTPLHQAVIHNNWNLANALLLAGANINLPTKGHAEKTALHLAYRDRNREMVELLLQFGADVNKKDGKKRPPNHWLGLG